MSDDVCAKVTLGSWSISGFLRTFVVLLLLYNRTHGQSLYQYDLPGNLLTQSAESQGVPVIVGQPQAQVVSAGQIGSFSVVVADTLGVTYKWRFEGNNLGGATNDALLLTNVSAASEGNYSVVVANSSGSVTSAPAMLYWDSVGDGLPDSWKIKYSGSISNVTAASDAPLHDGISNLQKFLDGTNPTNGVGLRPRLELAGLNGSVTPSPDLDKYNLGQPVSLTVIPHPGFQFVGWSGNLLGTNNPATIAMDANKSITAVCGLPLPSTLNVTNNATNITWRSGGDVPWFGQDFVSEDGIAAAQNGPLLPHQVSWLEATIYMSGDGTVNFWWKRVASAAVTITFSVNGLRQVAFFPQGYWDDATYFLPAGTSVIRWTYEKTSETTEGFDALWVDEVSTQVYADPLADSDHDGLPDLWEYRYFGNLSISGVSDSDGDGVNNHDELVDGTDPLVSTSSLPRLVISASGGTVTPSPALEKYSYLQTVTLTATPNSGFNFVGWRGDLTGSTNPTTLIMDHSKAVAAVFARSLPNALAEAVDATNLTWSAGGDASFFYQTLTTHDNVDAAQSPPLATNQQAWVETTVNGPGPLSFWWKASASFADFRFLLNGVQQRSIAGSADWSQFTLNVPAGPNTLRWAFVKTAVALAPNDAAWLDQVVFGTNVPSITSVPVSRTVVQGSNVTFSVTAVSSVPLSYQWQRNGVNLSNGISVSGATTNTLTLSNVQPADAGAYTVLVSTPAATVSSAASLTVAALVPLADALDAPSQPWTSGGNAQWIGQNLITHDHVDAGQAGAIASGQESWLETTFTGPGALGFWWKLSGGASRFEFILDGVTNAITGTTGDIDWEPRSFLLSAGPHTVRWRYLQNSSSGAGAWLDQVVYTAGTPPSIAANPLSQIVNGGMNVSFSVSANGTGPLTYRWFFNRTNPLGSNSATLSLTNVQLANAGNYSVQVSNAIGKITSTSADLIVNVPPFITAQPVGGTALTGSNFTFSVTAGGGAPLYYQWRKDGTNLTGATQASLTLTNAQPSQSGGYALVVSNFLGSTTSTVAQLTIGIPPSITTQPVDQTANQGSTATFSVRADGTAPLYYQWRENNSAMPGRTTPDLVLTNVQFSDQAYYDVVVSNAVGSVTSDGAYLSIGFSSGPSIFGQPQSQTVQPDDSLSFSVLASGDPPLSYQWRRYGTNLPGRTASILSLTNVQSSDAGPYDVVVSNPSGSVTSDVAFLTVGSSVFTLSIIRSNSFIRLSWNALVGRDYQVLFKTNLVAASWSNLPPVITATNTQASATDPIGSSPRKFYRVQLLPQSNIPPSITTQPVTQFVSPGANVTFSVTADGAPPLHYQWRFNGDDLPGETSATLQLFAVQSGDMGVYDVVVTNSVDSVTSDPAYLFVF